MPDKRQQRSSLLTTAYSAQLEAIARRLAFLRAEIESGRASTSTVDRLAEITRDLQALADDMHEDLQSDD